MTLHRSLGAAALVAAAFAVTFTTGAPGMLRADEPTLLRRAVNVDEDPGFRRVEPTSEPGPYEDGYELVDGVYKCETKEYGQKGRGVACHYQLDQEAPKPIVVSCMSRAEGVKGGADTGYSLYIDLQYADGTPLWGRVAMFPTGDADWSEGRVVIFPAKPIKTLSAYGIFRGHVGTAYFKDFVLREQETAGETHYFDFVGSEQVGSLDPAPKIMFRGAAEDSPLLGVSADKEALDADFGSVMVKKSTATLPSGAEEVVLDLRSQTEEDVAFTLYYSLPIPDLDDDAQWVWFDNPRETRTIDGDERRAARVLPAVGKGEASHYPLGVVARQVQTDAGVRWDAAFGIAVDPDFPAVYRVAANSMTKELYLAYDLALTKEKPEATLKLLPLCWKLDAPDSSDLTPVSFSQYQSAPEANTPFGSTPFRAAFDVWRRSFPDAFRVRALRQGNWMAFAKISKVKDWEDFGFAFKEGIDEIGEDDARGVSTFRYTEPMTWWQQVQKSDNSPKTREAALELAKSLAVENRKRDDGSPEYNVAEARSLFTTGMREANGEFSGMLLDTPWCDGVVWSLNEAPGLVRLVKEGKLNVVNGVEPLAGFELKWNDALADAELGKPLDKLPETRQELLDAQANPGVDGEYVDSSEGYVTTILDFTREYFEGMETPLTFDAKSGRPAIFRGLVAYEYVRKISEDVHARGALSMANATPHAHFWLAPQLDVLGTETNWNHSGGWRPMPDDELMYRRMLCCGKPYCFLMNTNFDEFDKDCSERYMKRALAYGMFPSFFSADASTRHYFDNPELYERDRPLFRKYMPIVTRVAQAGWEPEPCAKTNDAKLYVERFGALPGASAASNPFADENAIYLTLFNDSDEPKDYELTLADELLDAAETAVPAIREEIDDDDVTPDDDGVIRGAIAPQDVKVFRIAVKNRAIR